MPTLDNQAEHRDSAHGGLRPPERTGRHGVFETGGGAVCRHRTRERLDELLGAFDPVAERTPPVRTMDGRPTVAAPLLVARR
ncbi:hypothetical protein [Kitasatospora sp. A2-31]|uniref:hypothetical protein n=1 Tax=Kitasatospora sp. A2-31 TaxID=2916414 RepID=UPI001EEC8DCD|nr:hypothetical protein [Kitasatospora sp. A2-31]MCG6498511.1 hypothetical protein [Kitasatospora sp. A2-31]